MGNRKINLSIVFAGQSVGIREVADKIWLGSFMEYDLGFFDENEGRVEPATKPSDQLGTLSGRAIVFGQSKLDDFDGLNITIMPYRYTLEIVSQ